MKTIICIILLGYWMFRAAPENTGKTVKQKKGNGQMIVQRQNSSPYTKATVQLIYLDAKGNIAKADLRSSKSFD